MPEYIEREALLLRIDCHGTNKFGMLDENIRAFVKAQPAVDAAPVVHGKWISNSSLNKCSECRTLWDTKTNFCPYCGAKMDGKEDGADHE